jgi:glycosyltransferase involved in cell wall biosynthesis
MLISSKKPAYMNKPLVSIITPSLNQGRYIEETILSVFNQTYDNIEYIIMDGGSTDNTFEIVSKYKKDPRLSFYSQKDEGQYDAVNKGFLMARGDILGWINTDDIYTERTLEKVLKVFDANHEVEIVYGNYYSFMVKRKLNRIMFNRDFSHKWLRRYCYTNPSVTFIRKSVIQNDRLFIDNSVFTYGDWDWYLRMAEQGKKFHHLQEILGYFRIHPCSRIMRMNQRQIRLERCMIAQRHSIPLNYITLWVDFVIPWFERIQNLEYLIRRKEWCEIGNRIINVSKILLDNFKGKLT